MLTRDCISLDLEYKSASYDATLQKNQQFPVSAPKSVTMHISWIKFRQK